ncbi:RNA polymerase sigma factor [Streptomyces sp. NPDC021019]|uniref:RNA polymerase sigma factor n=1 Tax=Streptomyces sp. NPDC021019 TaxID=3365108 RepID=UPI0037B7BCA2
MPAATTAISPIDLFTAAYHQYRPMVRNTILGRLTQYGAPDTHLAEDLTQNTFLALLRYGDRITEVRNIGGLLRVMARQSVSHHYRLKRNQCEKPADTGSWQYANRNLGPTAAGYYTTAATGSAAPAAPRRLVAVGTITRHGGRTTTVRATEAGVTGTITNVCPTCRLIFEACTCTGGAQ